MMGQIKLDFMINILHNKETEARLAKRVSLLRSTKFYLLCLILLALPVFNRHLKYKWSETPCSDTNNCPLSPLVLLLCQNLIGPESLCLPTFSKYSAFKLYTEYDTWALNTLLFLAWKSVTGVGGKSLSRVKAN